jgi:hypothetical protein
MKARIFILFFVLIINTLYSQNCPFLSSENGYTNGVFHPAWMDCTLPSAPIFDESHFQIIPNSPFNYDENTPYYHVTYPMLKKLMSRTSCTENNQLSWIPNTNNPNETYCNSPQILAVKKEMLRTISGLKSLNTKCITVQWIEESWTNNETNGYNITMDITCEVHALKDSITGENFGNETVVGAYLPEVMKKDFLFGNVSDWVYAYFEEGIPAEKEEYNSNNIQYMNDWRKEGFGEGTIIPDMSRRITQFWFFERAAKYIDAGCELLSLGQVETMNDNDPGHIAYYRLVKAIRKYAAKNARRHFVLIEGETQGFYYCPDFQDYIEKEFPQYLPKNNLKTTWKINSILPDLQDKFFDDNHVSLSERQLIFDYHNQPLRMQETLDRYASSPFSYQPTELKNDANWVFGNSKGGKNPNEWTVPHNPYHSMIDKGSVGRMKNASDGICDEPECIFQWGYDEITWYAMQPDWYRMYWVCYMKNWFLETDTAAFPVYQGLRWYGWQYYNGGVGENFFGGYIPTDWELISLKRQIDEPNLIKNCAFPTALTIEGEQVIYMKEDNVRQKYVTQYIPNQQYVWQIFANGTTRIVTDSPYLELNIPPNVIDTVYYLSVYALDKEANMSFASLNRFPIVISNSQSIKYYPNPVANLFTIVTQNIGAKIEIYDVNGIRKCAFTSDNQLNTIDINAYQAGLYLLKVIENNKTNWFRFMKI